MTFLKRTTLLIFLLLAGLIVFISLYEPVIEAPFREYFHHTPEGRVRIITTGDLSKPPIIFVHGSPGSWSNFEKLMSEMALDFYCVSYDRLGFGKSEKQGDFHALSVHVKTLKHVIDFVSKQKDEKKPVFIAGHSYGAPVAIQFGLEQSEKCQGLLLLGAAIDPSQEDLQWYNHLLTKPIARILVPKFIENSNDELIPLEHELKKQDLRALKIPCLVMHGQKDRLVPVQNAHYASEMIPEVKVRILADQGHFIPWSIPSEVAEEFKAFFLKP